MEHPPAAGDASTRAEQLVACAEDPDHPVAAEARAALIDALTEDLARAESLETRLAKLEAQLAVVLVLLDRGRMP